MDRFRLNLVLEGLKVVGRVSNASNFCALALTSRKEQRNISNSKMANTW